jgi:hypothetical protein
LFDDMEITVTIPSILKKNWPDSTIRWNSSHPTNFRKCEHNGVSIILYGFSVEHRCTRTHTHTHTHTFRLTCSSSLNHMLRTTAGFSSGTWKMNHKNQSFVLLPLLRHCYIFNVVWKQHNSSNNPLCWFFFLSQTAGSFTFSVNLYQQYLNIWTFSGVPLNSCIWNILHYHS